MKYLQLEIQSLHYRQARKLRYQLFFETHKLSTSILDDDLENTAGHHAFLINNTLVAYLRINDLGDGTCKLSQMVVDPSQQGKGYGGLLMTNVLNTLVNNGVRVILLASRLSAQLFYRKLGFETYGEIFPSKTTQVPHIMMKLALD